MAAAERTGVKRNPFHPFGMFDTASLAGLMFGQTVLVKACLAAKIPFDGKQAHSALYDTERTAELFCYMVNHLKDLGGFPHISQIDETENTAENQTALLKTKKWLQSFYFSSSLESSSYLEI